MLFNASWMYDNTEHSTNRCNMNNLHSANKTTYIYYIYYTKCSAGQLVITSHEDQSRYLRYSVARLNCWPLPTCTRGATPSQKLSILCEDKINTNFLLFMTWLISFSFTVICGSTFHKLKTCCSVLASCWVIYSIDYRLLVCSARALVRQWGKSSNLLMMGRIL